MINETSKRVALLYQAKYAIVEIEKRLRFFGNLTDETQKSLLDLRMEIERLIGREVIIALAAQQAAHENIVLYRVHWNAWLLDGLLSMIVNSPGALSPEEANQMYENVVSMFDVDSDLDSKEQAVVATKTEFAMPLCAYKTVIGFWRSPDYAAISYVNEQMQWFMKTNGGEFVKCSAPLYWIQLPSW